MQFSSSFEPDDAEPIDPSSTDSEAMPDHVLDEASSPTPQMQGPLLPIEPVRTAAQLLGEGFWSEADGRVSVSARFKELLGYPELQLQMSSSLLTDLVHPDDLEGLKRSLAAREFSTELRLRREGGRFAYFLLRGWREAPDYARTVGTLAPLSRPLPSEENQADALLAEAVEHGLDALLVLKAVRDSEGEPIDFEIVELNTKGAQILGAVRAKALGRLLSQVAPVTRENGVARQYAEIMRAGKPSEHEFYASPGGFQQVWFVQRIVPLSDGVAVFASDVSESRRAGDSAERSRRMFEKIAGTTPDLLTLWDVETRRFVYANRDLHQSLGYLGETRAVTDAGLESLVHFEDLEAFRAHFQRLASEHGDSAIEGTFRFRIQSAEYRWLLFRDIVFDRDDHGSPKTVLCDVRDVTRQKSYEQDIESQVHDLARAREDLEAKKRELEGANVRLTDLALTDGLTGVKNRRAFQERLSEEVERAQRYNLRLALLLADADHFKQYNDKYGHPGGDDALRGIAQVLLDVCRKSDTVARYGGEEFAIILPNTGSEEAARLGDRIRAKLNETLFGSRGVTASIGCSEFAPGKDAQDRLVSEADRALYQSKEAGRDRVTVFKE